MPTRLLKDEQVSQLRESLRTDHVELEQGDSFVAVGGRAEVHRGYDALWGDAEVVVRVARLTRGIHAIADDYDALWQLLGGCRDGFMLPVRKVKQSLEGWEVSIWEKCSASLHDLKQEGGLPSDELLPHFRNIARALDHLAERSWIHGDVTPRNILIRNGIGVLSDYDLMRPRIDTSSIFEHKGGTKGYLAPDFKNSSVFSADLYSLAVCYAELRCGEHPFTGKNPNNAGPKLTGMGPQEKEVVRIGLSPEHEDRIAYGSRALHTSWFERLQAAVDADREGVEFTPWISPKRRLPELRFGIHGIRDSGKTTLLAMTHHQTAEAEMKKQGFVSWNMVPEKDEEGPENRTLDYLEKVLRKLRKEGSIERTMKNTSFSLRFQVTVAGKQAAIINIDDYGGELVQILADPERDTRQMARERRERLANSDAHIFFAALDHEHNDVQFAIDQFKGYLEEARRVGGPSPGPVIVVVYTKADLVEELDLRNPGRVADFRDDIWSQDEHSTQYRQYWNLSVKRIRELIPGAVILRFVVSSFGEISRQFPKGDRERTEQYIRAHYDDLKPLNIWVPFGRAVERAIANVDAWIDDELDGVKRHLANGRLSQARAALAIVEPRIARYLSKTPRGPRKLATVKAELAAQRRAAFRRKLVLAARALAATTFLCLIGWTGWRVYKTVDASRIYRSRSSGINAIPEADFRRRYAARNELLHSWVVGEGYVPPDQVAKQREYLAADLKLIEEADYESEKRQRRALKGEEHAAERLARLPRIPTREGSYRSEYDKWQKDDESQLDAVKERSYWARETLAAARLLAVDDRHPDQVLAEAERYHLDFPRGSRTKEIAAKESKARAQLRETTLATARNRARSLDTANALPETVLPAWREVRKLAADHPFAKEAEDRISAIEADWDKKQYERVRAYCDQLVQKGFAAKRAEIATFAIEGAHYLDADRVKKTMALKVDMSRECALRIVEGEETVDLFLKGIDVPYHSHFWSWGWFTNPRDPTIFQLQTSKGSQEIAKIITQEGSHSFGPAEMKLSVPASWNDQVVLNVFKRPDKAPVGTQSAGLLFLTQRARTIPLRPETAGDEPAKVMIDFSADNFDLRRLKLPPYQTEVSVP